MNKQTSMSLLSNIFRFSLISLALIWLIACESHEEYEFRDRIGGISYSFQQLKSQLEGRGDSVVMTNLIILKKYAALLRGQRPDLSEIIDDVAKEATVKGSRITALENRIKSLEMASQQSNVDWPELLQQLYKLQDATDTENFNKSLIEDINLLTDLSENKLPRNDPYGFLISEELAVNSGMVKIHGGCFQMGNPDDSIKYSEDERPAHKVCLDDFEIGKYEITQGQWQKVMGNNPSFFYNEGTCTSSSCPVEDISWEDVQTFIKKLNSQGNGTFRLPTEAEWEYACRSGGRDQKHCGANNPKVLRWDYANSDAKTHPVGQKQANGLGLYDMSGNVGEWVEDWYGKSYYSKSSVSNPKGPPSGANRAVRGGAISHSASRATSRYHGFLTIGHGKRDKEIGARLVREP